MRIQWLDSRTMAIGKCALGRDYWGIVATSTLTSTIDAAAAAVAEEGRHTYWLQTLSLLFKWWTGKFIFSNVCALVACATTLLQNTNKKYFGCIYKACNRLAFNKCERIYAKTISFLIFIYLKFKLFFGKILLFQFWAEASEQAWEHSLLQLMLWTMLHWVQLIALTIMMLAVASLAIVGNRWEHHLAGTFHARKAAMAFVTNFGTNIKV